MRHDENAKKTVVITAGNRGGGACIALRYANANYNVAIIADKEGSSDVSNQIVAQGGQSRIFLRPKKFNQRFTLLPRYS